MKLKDQKTKSAIQEKRQIMIFPDQRIPPVRKFALKRMKALLEDVMIVPIKKLLLAKKKCFPVNNQVQPVVIQNQVIVLKF